MTRLKFVKTIRLLGERGRPSGGRLLSVRKNNLKQENFQKIKNHVSQGNDFISPMKKV
jgi:hypothetical protein